MKFSYLLIKFNLDRRGKAESEIAQEILRELSHAHKYTDLCAFSRQLK